MTRKSSTWEPDIELGSLVEDVVTGFKGIAVCCARHIHLCDRYTVQPLYKEGAEKTPESLWIDGHALRVLRPPTDELRASVAAMNERITNKETPAKVGCAAERGNKSI